LLDSNETGGLIGMNVSTWDRTDIGTIKMDKGSLYFSDSLMPIGKKNA